VYGGWILCGIWGGIVDRHRISAGMYFDFYSGGTGFSRVFSCADSMRGVVCMKIVVVRSPKLFSGLLRRMFGIKRQDYIE